MILILQICNGTSDFLIWLEVQMYKKIITQDNKKQTYR